MVGGSREPQEGLGHGLNWGFQGNGLGLASLSHASGLWAKAWSLAAQVIQGRDGGPAREREGGGGGVESGWPVGERCTPGPALCLLEELGPVLVSLPWGQRPQRHQVSSNTQSAKREACPSEPLPLSPLPQAAEPSKPRRKRHPARGAGRRRRRRRGQMTRPLRTVTTGTLRARRWTTCPTAPGEAGGRRA